MQPSVARIGSSFEVAPLFEVVDEIALHDSGSVSGWEITGSMLTMHGVKVLGGAETVDVSVPVPGRRIRPLLLGHYHPHRRPAGHRGHLPGSGATRPVATHIP
jgi:hypothetical protein